MKNFVFGTESADVFRARKLTLDSSNQIMKQPPATTAGAPQKARAARSKPKYPGIRVTCNGNQLVTQYVETRITEGGVFYPITPSTEGGEIYQGS